MVQPKTGSLRVNPAKIFMLRSLPITSDMMTLPEPVDGWSSLLLEPPGRGMGIFMIGIWWGAGAAAAAGRTSLDRNLERKA